MMIFFNLAGLVLIGLIVWWFWLYKPTQSEGGQGDLLVEVNNGVYTPSRIKLPANQAVTIPFLRKDPSPCAEALIFPDLDISESLTVDKVREVSLPALKPGKYPFHCQMQMYRGELIVE